jgi:hypothetical protein
MKILFFGDIFGKPGREGLKKILPSLREKFAPDFVLANIENIAHGRGPGHNHIKEMQKLGIDGFTGGNHSFDNPESLEFLADPAVPLMRAANYPASVPGKDYILLKKGQQKLFVANFLGRIFMGDPIESPFVAADEILKKAKKLKIKHIFFDLHAEATSEKNMFGQYCTGRASVIVGTHTHVQTADERILDSGTAYISDVGMCGPRDGVIGADLETAKRRFTTGLPTKLEVADGPVVISGVIIELDDKTGKANKIERILEILA